MSLYWLLIFFLISIIVFAKSLYETKQKHNPFGVTPFLYPFGIFVWADGVIIGLFWSLVSAVSNFLQDQLLFIFIVSLFWLVRSIGETIYWLNQQFSPVKRNSPQNLLGHSVFQNDSVWFVYQVFWQCLTVISLILSVYFGAQWLASAL